MTYKLDVRTFIKGKFPDQDYCEDSLVANLDCMRFAVADGVTNSYRSGAVSEYLATRFAQGDIPIETWPKALSGDLENELNDWWHEKCHQFIESRTPFDKEIQQRRLLNKGPGASTFCGIEIDLKQCCISYAVLGDSCLFVISETGNTSIATTCTIEKSENGEPHIQFNSVTLCIMAQHTKELNEEDWSVGNIPLEKGMILLMTDGTANWFQQQREGNGIDHEQLWNMLDDSTIFEEYIVQSRSEDSPLTDDISLIMIKVKSAEDEYGQDKDEDTKETENATEETVEKTTEELIENAIQEAETETIEEDIESATQETEIEKAEEAAYDKPETEKGTKHLMATTTNCLYYGVWKLIEKLFKNNNLWL